ncbi:unnamed protein product [Rhodiola kirilowii]
MSCSNQGQLPIDVPPQGTPTPPDQFIYDPSSTYEVTAHCYAPVRYDQRPRRQQPVTRRTGRGNDIHESCRII